MSVVPSNDPLLADPLLADAVVESPTVELPVEPPTGVPVTEAASSSVPSETLIDPSTDAMAELAALLGYAVFERVASTEVDVSVLESASPPEGKGFKYLGAEPRHPVDLRIMSEAGDMQNIEDILMRRWVKDGEQFAGDFDLVKRWTWELVAMARLSDPPLYPSGWWDGVVVRASDSSRTRVRELRMMMD